MIYSTKCPEDIRSDGIIHVETSISNEAEGGLEQQQTIVSFTLTPYFRNVF